MKVPDSLVLEFQSAESGSTERSSKRPPDSPIDNIREETPRESILAEVRKSGTISTRICVQRLGISRATAQRMLSSLVEEQILEKTGSGPGTRYRLRHEAM